jgi:hypothetical protein
MGIKIPNRERVVVRSEGIEGVMDSSFKLINDLTEFLDPMGIGWFVSGGWAIDIHLDRPTRERGDIDISVPSSDRFEWIDFFLKKDWQIEGKLLDGFKTIKKLSDYDDEIHYFWSFPKGADFVSEYFDENGNRRIAYNRYSQTELDYLEVFFDRIERGHFIYRREQQIKRHLDQAIRKRDNVRYLAPELVLLFKSNRLSEKNLRDFNVVVDSLDRDAQDWLREALSFMYGSSHPWLEKLRYNG